MTSNEAFHYLHKCRWMNSRDCTITTQYLPINRTKEQLNVEEVVNLIKRTFSYYSYIKVGQTDSI